MGVIAYYHSTPACDRYVDSGRLECSTVLYLLHSTNYSSLCSALNTTWRRLYLTHSWVDLTVRTVHSQNILDWRVTT